MISDVSRTGTYRKAILGNAAVAFRDKIVLDVGAGGFGMTPKVQGNNNQALGYCHTCPPRPALST
jgi:hypothetical protein